MVIVTNEVKSTTFGFEYKMVEISFVFQIMTLKAPPLTSIKDKAFKTARSNTGRDFPFVLSQMLRRRMNTISVPAVAEQ